MPESTWVEWPVRMRIFVAGHRGLVGSALVRRLQGAHDLVLRTRAQLDLTRREAVESFFAAEKPELVFLCAARVGGIEANRSRPAEFIADNVLIETSVIHAAYQAKARLVFFGSTCLYPRDCPQPMKESAILSGPFEPTSAPYSVAKLTGLTMCESYNRQYGTHFKTVIPATLYGPHDNFDPASSHVLSALLRRLHESRDAPSVSVWGTGKPVREFLYVDDLVDALMFLLDRDFESPINIGSGVGVTIRELAEQIAVTTGFKGKLEFDASRPDGAPAKVLDVSRLSEMGWKAGTTLHDGLRKTYDWWRKNA
ncbi:MAG TPA: GDP-L-fucose synthase [Burkholderiales bacterium]|nr:GDP-L-fucose synthase [Burkholderiales bacterium]